MKIDYLTTALIAASAIITSCSAQNLPETTQREAAVPSIKPAEEETNNARINLTQPSLKMMAVNFFSRKK